MPAQSIVVIGASAGGVEPLLKLVAGLPAELPAAVAVVLHVGRHRSILPELLNSRGSLPARHGRDGEPLQDGTIYVAPPDRHLLLTPDSLRLSDGPRENHARPAVDPLFRTAALHFGPRAIGVVLSGALDDGTAGLAAIKHSGGKAIVQDPATAFDPAMPTHAIAQVQVDHCLEPGLIGPTLAMLLAAPAPAAPPAVPEPVRREHAAFEGEDPVENLNAIGTLSHQACPDCGGTLWELNDKKPLRYRCHIGHAYSAMSLRDAQQGESDHSLQSSLRLLEQRELLLRRLAAVSAGTGDAAQAAVGLRQADHVGLQARALRQLIAQPPAA